MGRERGGSSGDGGGARGWWRWRGSSGGRGEDDFRGDLERNGREQNRRDQGSARSGAGSWPGGSESAGGKRTENDQGRRDESRSRRDEKKDGGGGGEGGDKELVPGTRGRKGGLGGRILVNEVGLKGA